MLLLSYYTSLLSELTGVKQPTAHHPHLRRLLPLLQPRLWSKPPLETETQGRGNEEEERKEVKNRETTEGGSVNKSFPWRFQEEDRTSFKHRLSRKSGESDEEQQDKNILQVFKSILGHRASPTQEQQPNLQLNQPANRLSETKMMIVRS